MSKGLLLVDIQNDYFPGGKSELFKPEKALENCIKALTIFRTNDLPIIHIQHINIREGATFFLPNTHGVEIHESLTPKSNEEIIIKHSPNSFFETILEKALEEKGVSELVICGMMTHMCIDTTVRAAKDYEIPVTVIKDACATKDLFFGDSHLPAEIVSNVYFASLNNAFAKVISISELFL